MNPNETRTDMAAGLSQWLDTLCGFYIKDLQATPDELIYASPGGKARSPHHFTVEAMCTCQWTTEILGGKNESSLMGEEAWGRLCDATTTKAELIANLESTCAAFKEALLAAPAERFGVMIMAPFGMEMPVAALANIFVNHLWYHDGQLCQIQAMNGDTDVHWMA
ncbi:MAG: hypothetical protein JNJ45_12155 [Chthonomonas sp.]|nr:hypothetical protein [Chthonomonas sp.]